MFYALNNKCRLDNLSYVIGAILSDGCIYKSKINNPYSKTTKIETTWTIELSVRDKEFAEEFLQRLLKVIKRPEKRTNKLNIHINEGVKFYRVCIRNKGFGDWFSNLTHKEISKIALKYPIEFLRAFYNAEGNLSQMGIRIFNTNKNLINLIGKLLCFIVCNS
jgi:intein-encoded DNA endonuclease-like protein